MKYLLIFIFTFFLIGFVFVPDVFAATYFIDIPKTTSQSTCPSSDSCFLPDEINVQKGDTIKWRNLDTIAHTVTSKNGVFDSGPLISNTQSNSCFPNCSPTFTYKFDEYGVYNYHCTIHSWMQGIVSITEFGAGAEVSASGEGGDVFVDKKIYEVTGDQEANVKVYGNVLHPGAGNKIFLTVTYPDGDRDGLTTFVTTKGYFETFIIIGSENRGTINLSVTHTEHFNIGTLSFEVVKKTPPLPEVPTSPPNDNTTLVVDTDSKSYKSGSQIRIFGVVPYLGESNPYYGSDLTIQIVNPQNSIVTISQVTPSDDGSYSKLINSEGPTWKTEGEYTVNVLYGTETASTTFAFTNPNTPSPTPSKTSTVLTLNPMSTFDATGSFQSGDRGAEIFVSGTLMSADREYVITGAEIRFVPYGFTFGNADHGITITDHNGEFETSWVLGVGNNYAVQAVFDGTSDFHSSSSTNKENFIVTSPPISPPMSPPEEPDPSGGIALLVIIMIVVIVAIAIKRRKKMIPPIQTSGSRVSPKPEKVFPKVEKVLPKPSKEKDDEDEENIPQEYMVRDFRKGDYFYSIKKYEKALFYYNKELKENKDLYDIISKKAHTLFHLTRFDEAIECYDQNLKRYPDRPEFWRDDVGKGNALKAMGKLDEAKKCYNDAIKKSPFYAHREIKKRLKNITENTTKSSPTLPIPAKVSHKAEKPISKSPDRFECKCGHHTCKKFYRTKRQLRLHQGGVKAAKKKAEAEKMYRDISLSPSEMKQYIQDVKKHTEKEKARLAKEAKEKEAEKMYRNIDKLHGKEPEVSATNSVSRVKKKRSYEPIDFATEAEKQWIKDHDFKTESELEKYIKDTKDTQKYDDDGNLRSEVKKPTHREIKQDVNKSLEKEPEIIQTISREMVNEYLDDKYTINKSLKIQYIDEYRIHKSVAKVIELHSATGSTRKEGEIKRHLITGLRLPAELRKLEEEGGLHANYGCSKKIALFATDYFSWDGQKNKEKDVVNLAVAISEYLQSDLELNQKFQEGKRSNEFLIDQQKRDKIHEKYRFEEYSSSWQRVDRTVPQYNKLYRNKNLEVVEFLCRWEFKHKNRLPFRIADALLDNPEEALEKYKDELL